MVHPLRGVYAAIVTPYGDDGSPSQEAFVSLLQHLATRGLHGVLVAGTTGEGPSLTVDERIRLFSLVRKMNADLRLLAGTGAASLQDSMRLTRAAFDYGADGIVVIPPFFYSDPSEEGLFAFYESLIHSSVPSDGNFLLYHNPFVSAPSISRSMISRLLDAFPNQITGIKDSSGDWSYMEALRKDFPDLQILLGSDKLMARGLDAGAAGGITALSGVFPELIRDVFDAYEKGQNVESRQQRLSATHMQFDGLPRIQAYKWLLWTGNLIGAPHVRPPLAPLSSQEVETLSERFHLNIPTPQSIDMENLAS